VGFGSAPLATTHRFLFINCIWTFTFQVQKNVTTKFFERKFHFQKMNW
jgi:hypothetical protein